MVKEEYEKLKKKYINLPDYDKINFEFEISTIEKPQFLLRRITEKIEEKFELLINVLSDILQPDTGSFATLYECNHFSEKEKQQALDLYKKLMTNYRALLETHFILEDLKDVELIKQITDEWPELRKQAIPIITKLKQCWHTSHQAKEILNYLG